MVDSKSKQTGNKSKTELREEAQQLLERLSHETADGKAIGEDLCKRYQFADRRKIWIEAASIVVPGRGRYTPGRVREILRSQYFELPATSRIPYVEALVRFAYEVAGHEPSIVAEVWHDLICADSGVFNTKKALSRDELADLSRRFGTISNWFGTILDMAKARGTVTPPFLARWGVCVVPRVGRTGRKAGLSGEEARIILEILDGVGPSGLPDSVALLLPWILALADGSPRMTNLGALFPNPSVGNGSGVRTEPGALSRWAPVRTNVMDAVDRVIRDMEAYETQMRTDLESVQSRLKAVENERDALVNQIGEITARHESERNAMRRDADHISGENQDLRKQVAELSNEVGQWRHEAELRSRETETRVAEEIKKYTEWLQTNVVRQALHVQAFIEQLLAEFPGVEGVERMADAFDTLESRLFRRAGTRHRRIPGHLLGREGDGNGSNS